MVHFRFVTGLYICKNQYDKYSEIYINVILFHFRLYGRAGVIACAFFSESSELVKGLRYDMV